MAISSPTAYMNDNLLLPESYAKMDIIDRCYASINEATATPKIIEMTSSYTHEMILEVLESVKEQLMSIQSTILSYFNNYILNSANLADKYRDVLMDRMRKLNKPIVYRTYSYQKLFDKSFPTVISAKSSQITSDIEKLQDQLITDSSIGMDQQTEIVNNMIENFAYSVIGATVDPYMLQSSVSSVTRDILRGREQIRTLDSKTLSKFIEEIAAYKPAKETLARTKKGIIDDYNALKSIYMSSTMKKEAVSVGIESIRDPDFIRFNKAESERFATINMNMTRLFNGYITVYREVFNTELEVLREKIDSNRNIITKLMTDTGVFAAINAKNPPVRNKAPYVFDPKIPTPKRGTNL